MRRKREREVTHEVPEEGDVFLHSHHLHCPSIDQEPDSKYTILHLHDIYEGRGMKE